MENTKDVIIDLDKSRDELILKTKDFIDTYVGELPKEDQQDFKIALAALCMNYFEQGVDACVHEALKLNEEKPNGD